MVLSPDRESHGCNCLVDHQSHQQGHRRHWSLATIAFDPTTSQRRYLPLLVAIRGLALSEDLVRWEQKSDAPALEVTPAKHFSDKSCSCADSILGEPTPIRRCAHWRRAGWWFSSDPDLQPGWAR